MSLTPPTESVEDAFRHLWQLLLRLHRCWVLDQPFKVGSELLRERQGPTLEDLDDDPVFPDVVVTLEYGAEMRSQRVTHLS